MLAQVLLTSFNGDTINIIVHCHHSDSQQDPDNDSDASETNRLRRCFTSEWMNFLITIAIAMVTTMKRTSQPGGAK